MKRRMVAFALLLAPIPALGAPGPVRDEPVEFLPPDRRALALMPWIDSDGRLLGVGVTRSF